MTIFKLFLDQTRLSGTIQIFSGGYAALAVFKLLLDQTSLSGTIQIFSSQYAVTI